MEAQEALFSRSQAAVLSLLFMNPRRRFFLREIVQHARVGYGAVQRELARLLAAQLVVQHQEGRRRYYQANPEHFIYHQLVAIVQRSLGPVNCLHRALEPLKDKIRVAFIYGSIAKGAETPESDVDVMVVGSATFAEVVDALHPAHDQLLREVNPNVFPPEEFREKLRARQSFLTRVVEGPRWFVIGGPDDLAELA